MSSGQANRTERYMLRGLFITLAIIFLLRIESWPFSHFPVYSTAITPGEISIFRFAIQYRDGRVVFPLRALDARRVDVFMEHETSERYRIKAVGEMNLKAAIGLLRVDYHQRFQALSKLLEGMESAYILEEKYRKKEAAYELIETQKFYEISDKEFYAQIL